MEFSPLSKAQEDILKKVYYDDKILVGRDRLYKYIQNEYPDVKISLRGIGNWLKNQKVSQLFQQTKETKDIKRTILKEPFSVIGVDLVDMSNKQYGNYKWIFTAIDLFTKKAWAIPLINKENKTVSTALILLLKQMNEIPKSIRSDNGSEFISDEFRKILKKNNIQQILGKPNTPQSNGQIENFNKILKRMIEMDSAYSDNKNWVDTIHVYLNAYNNTPNRITGKTPNSIKKNDYKEVNNNIEKNIFKDTDNDNKPQFKKGDVVRLKLEKEGFSKSFENWSRELYMISNVNVPRNASVFKPSYKIMDKNGKVFNEFFYDNDLQLITHIEGLLKSPDKFIVSKIIKLVIKNGEPYYVVKWRNEKATTTEPRSSLIKDIPKVIAKFEKENNINL